MRQVISFPPLLFFANLSTRFTPNVTRSANARRHPSGRVFFLGKQNRYRAPFNERGTRTPFIPQARVVPFMVVVADSTETMRLCYGLSCTTPHCSHSLSADLFSGRPHSHVHTHRSFFLHKQGRRPNDYGMYHCIHKRCQYVWDDMRIMRSHEDQCPKKPRGVKRLLAARPRSAPPARRPDTGAFKGVQQQEVEGVEKQGVHECLDIDAIDEECLNIDAIDEECHQGRRPENPAQCGVQAEEGIRAAVVDAKQAEQVHQASASSQPQSASRAGGLSSAEEQQHVHPKESGKRKAERTSGQLTRSSKSQGNAEAEGFGPVRQARRRLAIASTPNACGCKRHNKKCPSCKRCWGQCCLCGAGDVVVHVS